MMPEVQFEQRLTLWLSAFDFRSEIVRFGRTDSGDAWRDHCIQAKSGDQAAW
jgi:hypothetical protein